MVLDVGVAGDGGGRAHNQQYAAESAGAQYGRYGGNDVREQDSLQDEREGNAGGDTRFIVKKRVQPWAMNLLGTEEDLRASMERVGL